MISADRLARACLAGLLLLCLHPGARADTEVRDASGRRILLEDKGTWRYLDSADKPAADAPPPVRASLALTRQSPVPGGCSFELVLDNRLPYEIVNVVPYFAVFRRGGVAYTTEGLHFGPVRPGDTQRRELRIGGLACADIARLQVQGGDRCEMGELNKFSDAKGECLARLQVLPSDLLKFEK